jgi:multifunctional cyclase/dehydratase/O-methyltransferase
VNDATDPGRDPVTALTGGSDELSPRARLLLLATGMRVTQVIYALAELGIAGHLADGPRGVAELAAAADCDATTLARLLRAAASVGVFTETAPETFGLTPTARLLRPDVPDSQLDLILYNGRTIYPVYGGIAESARTGRESFPDVFGADFYEACNTRPEVADIVYRAADRMDLDIVEHCLAHIDLARFGVVVDIGGGTGVFLARLLAGAPHARGVVVDRPEVMPIAKEALEQAGLADRMDLVGADFFSDPLPPGDLYILKNTLHSLDDATSVRLMRRVRTAMGGNSGARLLVCEQVVESGGGWDHAKFHDIDMLLMHGGRARTVAEWEKLAAAADLRLEESTDVLMCAPV